MTKFLRFNKTLFTNELKLLKSAFCGYILDNCLHECDFMKIQPLYKINLFQSPRFEVLKLYHSRTNKLLLLLFYIARLYTLLIRSTQ